MPEASAPPFQPDWISLTRQVIQDIADLFEQYSQQHPDAIESDYSKLLEAAGQLENFCLEQSDLNQQQRSHEIRNLIGTILGYSELILEEGDYLPAQRESLHAIGHLCKQILLTEAKLSTDTSARRPRVRINVPAGTIMIVDDQAASREILSRYLKQDNHLVLEVANGEDMFKILRQFDVDVILLDLILPEMDGDQLLQRLKSDEKFRAIPTIVVSGNKDVEKVIHCIESGAEDYMFKPFNPTLLQARIKAGIERKRWHNREEQYRRELERNQQFIRHVFGRYLSDEIVANLLENPAGLDLGGVQRKVTVLMADIRGFTTIAEKLPPERVVRLLNIYLGTMSDIILTNNGTIDEFIGDAILAIFGAPISRSDDTDRAVRCALKMQAAMADINHRNRQQNLPEITMGVSLNTGMVVAGNIGSEKRAKYGVVGHAVNQTARIEEQCEAGRILISEATLQDCQSLLSIGHSKTIRAKGILRAIKIYDLNGIAPLPEQPSTQSSSQSSSNQPSSAQ